MKKLYPKKNQKLEFISTSKDTKKKKKTVSDFLPDNNIRERSGFNQSK